MGGVERGERVEGREEHAESNGVKESIVREWGLEGSTVRESGGEGEQSESVG